MSQQVRESTTFKILKISQKKISSPRTGGIECELSVESLFDPPEYEALSYTWGSATQDCPIRIHTTSEPVGTETVLVTQHLHAALLRLRQPTAPRLVWIDQLCINQNNIQEKNAQVRLMADIYKRAQRTVVWLGEVFMLDEDRDAIIDATNRMSYRPDNAYSSLGDVNIIQDLIGFEYHGENREIGMRRRQVLADLLDRPWFTRAWVFQEAVVAKRGIVLCGSLEIDMEVLINLLDGVCDRDFQELGETASIMHTSKGYKPMFAIREARFEEMYGVSSSRKSKWLAMLWQGMGNLSATNQRDKIYAFLAFSDSEEVARIAPSYEKSVGSVYSDAALRSIRSMQSLDVLELAIKSDKSSFTLPSWVPDFSRPLPSLPFMTHNVGSTAFRASRGLSYPHLTQEPPQDFSKLYVRGCIISTVRSIAPMVFPNHGPTKTLNGIIGLTEIIAWVTSQLPLELDLSLHRIRERVLQALFAEGAGRDDTPGNLNYDDADALKVYNNEPMLLERRDTGFFRRPAPKSKSDAFKELELQHRYLQWLERVVKIMHHKKLFLSGHNEFGLAYEAVEEGDLICILLGSKTPTLLRKVSDEEGQGCYQFVAQCYVEGWMRGEKHEGRAWTEDDVKDLTVI
ncbi:MAG: hypothetical protein LQ350_001345 [Teloschistes chrysophthalmus]|nr:MAG: hypothetical protein LQ350_001345 [Niorma chrysophthalma]